MDCIKSKYEALSKGQRAGGGPYLNAISFELLRELASRQTFPIAIAGDCMAPLLANGSVVSVKRSRCYWPGDIIVFRTSNGGLLVHRLIGYYPRASRLKFLTQADAAYNPDAAIDAAQILGKVHHGGSAVPGRRVSPGYRVWAFSRFGRVVCKRLILTFRSSISIPYPVLCPMPGGTDNGREE